MSCRYLRGVVCGIYIVVVILGIMTVLSAAAMVALFPQIYNGEGCLVEYSYSTIGIFAATSLLLMICFSVALLFYDPIQRWIDFHDVSWLKVPTYDDDDSCEILQPEWPTLVV